MTAEVEPDQPTVDEKFSVEVTLESADGGKDSYAIEYVRLYDGPGDDAEELDEANPTGPFMPGTKRTVTLDEVEINDTGFHELRAEAVLVNDDDRRVVSIPVTVQVYRPHPLISVDTEPAVGNAWRTVDLTVANGLNESVDGVSVSVDGDGLQFRERERVASTIGPHEERAFDFEARPESPGVYDLEVVLTYEDRNGDLRRVEQTVSADFTEPDRPGEMRLTDVNLTTTADGVKIAGTASNVGDSKVESVVVAVGDAPSVEASGEGAETFVGSISANNATQFDLLADVDTEGATIPLTVTYRVDGVERTTTAEVKYAGAPGADAIELTGVSASASSDVVEITGSAANIGTVDAQSVVVAVGDAENVVPTGPQPEFFVGEVAESDFASFTVTAEVEGNETTIPLTVTYRVDGVEHTATTEVRYDAGGNEADEGAASDQNGGVPLSVTVGGALVLGLAAFGISYRRLR
ncbi:COG1361 family protein [Halorussus ruber]|uniref:hypothetical protein n=1 Tax=Halorussus ruber TaxID=1126238 RepID=UPI0010918FA0|nr:hypothetical protein [Halorussus ruber]